MKSFLILFVIGWTAAVIHAATQLTVTCAVDSGGDLTVQVGQASWGSYTSLYVAGHTSSETTITSALTYLINLQDLGISVDTSFTLQATVESDYVSVTDISEDWQCTRDTTAQTATASLVAQYVDGDDGTDSFAPTFTLAIKKISDASVVSTAPLDIGTELKLEMTLDSIYQGIYYFRIDDVEIKLSGGTFASLYDANRCSAYDNLIEDPGVKASSTTIDILFDAFRIKDTTNSNNAPQTIVFRVTVTPCIDQTICANDACADSPGAAERRKRSAGNETSAEMDSSSSQTLFIVQPPGTKPTELTANEKGTDDVLKGDGLCFGRAPVYAGAAIFMAILIAVSCFGFYLVLMARRRRNRKRLVESPSAAQSVMSVQCGHLCGKPHFQG